MSNGQVDLPPKQAPAVPSVELRAVSKAFGTVVAVDRVWLSVQPGEFLTLLGPSGCGKTTTLRMIGGFEFPTSGEILLHGEVTGSLPPNKRRVNTVFQNYALFPHMTVGQNIGFGLEMARVSRRDRARRIGEALELVQLPHVEDRKPAELSGGQQQRVALARALVNRPEVLLLDEPLGALDLKLRKAMQLELKGLNREVGITFIYVTHDQEEALTMSDRIAVMSEGRILQLGSPEEIYERPNSRFVADFIGQTNLLRGVLVSMDDGNAMVQLEGGGSVRAGRAELAPRTGEVTVAIRPEKVVFVEDLGQDGVPESWNILQGRVADIVYLGTHTQFVLRLPAGQQLTVHHQNRAMTDLRHRVGDEVIVCFDPASATVLVD